MSKRYTETIARVDIRIPSDIYEQIMAIATNHFHAKIHHRSGKPEVSPTILELIKIGIAHLERGVPDKSDISDKSVVTELKQQIQELDTRLREVENKLSKEPVTDTLPDISGNKKHRPKGKENHQDDESYLGITQAGIAAIFDETDKTDTITDTVPPPTKTDKTDTITDTVSLPNETNKADTITDTVGIDNEQDKTDKQGLTDIELAEVLEVSSNVLRRYRISGKKPRLRKVVTQLKEWEVEGDRWVKKHLGSP